MINIPRINANKYPPAALAKTALIPSWVSVPEKAPLPGPLSELSTKIGATVPSAANSPLQRSKSQLALR